MYGPRAAVYAEPTHPSPTHQMGLWRRRAEGMLAAPSYRGKKGPFFLISLWRGALCIWAGIAPMHTGLLSVLLVVDGRCSQLSKTGLVMPGPHCICTK